MSTTTHSRTTGERTAAEKKVAAANRYHPDDAPGATSDEDSWFSVLMPLLAFGILAFFILRATVEALSPSILALLHQAAPLLQHATALL